MHYIEEYKQSVCTTYGDNVPATITDEMYVLYAAGNEPLSFQRAGCGGIWVALNLFSSHLFKIDLYILQFLAKVKLRCA